MGVKLLVCYPSGAGGWWLTNLIHKLERNQHQNEHVTVRNFHLHTQSNSVYVSHYPITPLPDNLTFDKKINFSGNCFFNFYLNVVEKLYIDSNMLGRTFQSDCHLLSCEALNKFNFPATTDLDYNLIFTNPTGFIDNLFAVLDHSDIKYTKNTQLCLDSINQFQRSCPDPVLYAGDYDNIIWLGWCVGLLKYMQQPIPAYDDTLKDNLQQYHKLFTEITNDKILNF
jgi:hypothetical protein